MITNKEWERLELLLDVKIDQKLEKLEERLERRWEIKLEQKLDARIELLEHRLDEKLDEKLGEFARMIKNALDEIHHTIDVAMNKLNNHEYRIETTEVEIQNIKKVVRV